MVFSCDNCGFIFSRSTETEQCPDCGKFAVRPATEDEQKEFEQRMVELSERECSEDPRFPNEIDTEISMLSSFSFRLPATALQFNSTMIMDILVEYGESSADRDELAGNVWVREEGGRTVTYLMSVHMPAGDAKTPKEQVNRIFGALNDNDEFKTLLFHFVKEQLEKDG